VFEYKGTDIRIVNVSDSILLWTKDSKEETLIELLFVVNAIMSVAIQNGIPLRGSITKGDIEVVESEGFLSIVGKALVFAYEREKVQKWSGCIVSSNIITY